MHRGRFNFYPHGYETTHGSSEVGSWAPMFHPYVWRSTGLAAKVILHTPLGIKTKVVKLLIP